MFAHFNIFIAFSVAAVKWTTTLLLRGCCARCAAAAAAPVRQHTLQLIINISIVIDITFIAIIFMTALIKIKGRILHKTRRM